MGSTKLEVFSNESIGMDIKSTVDLISDSEDIETACLVAEQLFHSIDAQLFSVVICDTQNTLPTIRPFRKVSKALSKLSFDLRDLGGCPITREAIRLLRPFETKEIDRSQFKDFLSLKFLDELSMQGSQTIFVVPVLIGRGLALFSIGVNEPNLSSATKISIIDCICHMFAAILRRFPELATTFEPKKLSTSEAEIVLFSSNGYSDYEISRLMGISEISIGLIFKMIMRKLNSRNRSQMVSVALAFGEISNMQFRHSSL